MKKVTVRYSITWTHRKGAQWTTTLESASSSSSSLLWVAWDRILINDTDELFPPSKKGPLFYLGRGGGGGQTTKQSPPLLPRNGDDGKISKQSLTSTPFYDTF